MGTNSTTGKKKPDCFVHASASAIRRKRTLFSKEQLDILINYFQRNPYPDIEEREDLSRKITIDESRIQVWFQNRRSRQQKKQTSLASTNSRTWMHPENSSPSQIPEEDICKHDLSKEEISLPNAIKSDLQSGPGKPHQEAGPWKSPSIEERSMHSTTEATHSGYNISQDHHLISSQTMRSSTEHLLCTLTRPVFQENSSQCASSWALQGTQRPKNQGMHTSFCGRVKSPLHCQQQGRTTGQLSSHWHPLTFQCAQEPPCQLQQPYPQKPPAMLPLVPQTPTFQVQQLTFSPRQTQPPLLMRHKDQPSELFPSFNKQEQLQPNNLCKRTVGLGPTMLLPNGHLPDGHLPAHPRDLDTTLRNLDNILRGLNFPQGHMTAQILDDVHKQINDLFTIK